MLEALEHLWGWDKAKLGAELDKRADFFKDIVKRRKLSMAEMAKELRAFYARRFAKPRPNHKKRSFP